LGSTVNSNNWKTFHKIFGKNDALMLAFHRDLDKYLHSTNSIPKIDSSENKNAPYKFHFGSGIWYDNQALQLTPYFQKQISCLSSCHSPIDKTHYEDLVAIETDGMIDSFEYQSVDETLLIINAIYFEFKLRVDSKKSFIDRFVSWDGHESEVKYMNNIGQYLYVMDPTAQALLINYDNLPLSLLIVLPKNGEEPEPMTRYDINETIKRMKRTKIDLYLPKMEFENVHPLIEPLESVGFSYITKSSYDRATGNPSAIPIIQIVQKTKIKVIEDELYENLVSMDNTEDLPKVFKADHSFLFYFVHMPTKECVISGIFNSF
jgi:serine protease inhibitor